MTSLTESADGVFIKSDRSGRTRYSKHYKQEVLAAFDASSLSAPAFASQCGIKYPTFAAWLAGRKRGPQAEPAPDQPAFIVAEMDGAADSSTLEVRLPGGAVACAAGAAQVRLLAELLRHLA